MFEEYGENKNNLVVIGISLEAGDDQQKLEIFKKDNMGKYPEIEGKKYGVDIFAKYKSALGSGYPSLCLISPKTKQIVWKFKGFKSYADLDKILSENGVKKDPTFISNVALDKNSTNLSLFGIQRNRVTFSANLDTPLSIALLTLDGREVVNHVLRAQFQGIQSVTLSNQQIPKGTYILNVIGESNTLSKRVTVLK